MSDHRKLRQKIVNSFLVALFLVAAGAQITNPLQSSVHAGAAHAASDIIKLTSGTAKPGLRTQLVLMNSNKIVASRFYAPTHWALNWKK